MVAFCIFSWISSSTFNNNFYEIIMCSSNKVLMVLMMGVAIKCW
jgi:hypothetical protein